jgi:hypothetical protein
MWSTGSTAGVDVEGGHQSDQDDADHDRRHPDGLLAKELTRPQAFRHGTHLSARSGQQI